MSGGLAARPGSPPSPQPRIGGFRSRAQSCATVTTSRSVVFLSLQKAGPAHEAVPRPRRPVCLLPPWAPDVSWTRPHTPAARPRPLGLGFPGGHAGAAPSSWPSGIPPYGFASHCRPRVRAWTGGCFHRLAVVTTATPPPGRGERPEELPDPLVRSSRRAHLTPYTRSSLCKLALEGDDALRIFKSTFCAQQSGGWET